MAEETSARRRGSSSTPSDSGANYDYLNEIVKMAKKNGWDMRALGLVPRDLPPNPPAPVSKKEYQERNRLIRNVLKRFDRSLTPPVPLDLERSIRNREKDHWLPYEAEAIEKIDAWRSQVAKIKPDLLRELGGLHPYKAPDEPAECPAPD
jgi:hypothetical protein